MYVSIADNVYPYTSHQQTLCTTVLTYRWEEVLYRGFMLPAMFLHMSFWPSVLVSGLVFSAHHISATGAIPLAVLGWTWATIYAKSGNLLVTILIHAMWNSRVFLGSWLGL